MPETAMDGAAVTTPLPPGYPEAPDGRGRARKCVGGKLIGLGKYGTEKSVERYISLGLDAAHLKAIADAAPFTGDFPLGYPKADARGDATKYWNGKIYYFGKHGTQGSVERFNTSPVGQAFSAALATGRQDGMEWIDLDGTRWVTADDAPLGSRTLTKYRRDVGATPVLEKVEGQIRAKKVPMSSTYFCEFVWVYHAQDVEDLRAAFEMPPHLNLAELYSLHAITIVDPGAGYRVGDVLILQGGESTRPARIKVKNVNDSGGVTDCAATFAGAYTERAPSPATTTGGNGADFAVNVRFKKGQFGRLKILGFDEERSEKKRRHWWKVQCTCPKRTEKSVAALKLLSGNSKSCGCIESNFADARREHQKMTTQIVDGVEYWTPRTMMAFLDVSWTVLDGMWSATATKPNSEGRKKRAGCPHLPNFRAIGTRMLPTAYGRKVKHYVAADGRLARKAMDRAAGIPTPAHATRLEEALLELEWSPQTLGRRLDKDGVSIEKISGRASDGRMGLGFAFVPNWFIKKYKPEWEPAPSDQTDILLVAIRKEGRKNRATTKKVGARIGDELRGRHVEQTDAQILPTPKSHCLTVKVECRTVTLDGETFDVKSAMAVRWLKVLSDHPGEWLSADELKRFDRELDGARPDRLKKYVPDPVLRLIDSETGKGSRLRLA